MKKSSLLLPKQEELPKSGKRLERMYDSENPFQRYGKRHRKCLDLVMKLDLTNQATIRICFKNDKIINLGVSLSEKIS